MITNFSTSSIRTGVKRKRFWDQSAVANSFFSIATTTLSATQTTITFSSIPQTYTHLQIRWLGRTTRVSASAGAGAFTIQFNGDTGTNYSYHRLYGDGTSAGSDAGTTQSYGYCGEIIGDSATANAYDVGVVDILDYRDTNKYKTVKALFGGDINGGGNCGLYSSNWRSTSAITSLTIKVTNGSYDWKTNSSFALYGVLA